MRLYQATLVADHQAPVTFIRPLACVPVGGWTGSLGRRMHVKGLDTQRRCLGPVSQRPNKCAYVSCAQPFNVLRYQPGQHYDSHYDIFEPESYGPQASQRVRAGPPSLLVQSPAARCSTLSATDTSYGTPGRMAWGTLMRR